MEEIEYLYHYTSIESLALILKNKTIRLNPLDKMDDLQEQKTADVENLGKFVFVSSWTAEKTESIPMWKMYTSPVAGVRIRLPRNPFLRHGTKTEDILKVMPGVTMQDSTPNGQIDTFLDISKLMEGGYFSHNAWDGQILHKITYTNDTAKLEPKVYHLDGTTIHLNLGKLGKHKNLHWEFQKEWRYIMMFMSMNFKVPPEEMAHLASISASKMVKGIEKPPFRYYDLDIDPKLFADMEITCSPQMSVGNRVLLESLVEKYNPSAKIVESELLGKI